MSTITIDIPKEYGYVVLSTTATFLLSLWHGALVGSYRRKAKVPYPNCYASAEEIKESPEKYAFNCAQRSHANFLEHNSSVIAAMLISGLKFPIATSALGLGWTLSRILYATGYTNPNAGKNGTGRYRGVLFWFCELGLYGLTGWTGYTMLSA
jgi:glutathione S-transferase